MFKDLGEDLVIIFFHGIYAGYSVSLHLRNFLSETDTEISRIAEVPLPKLVPQNSKKKGGASCKRQGHL